MKLTRIVSLTLVSLFAIVSAVSAQDASDALPKFKQDALSVYISPSNQIHNIGFGDYRSEMERMNEVADVVVPILEKQGLKVYRNDPEKGIRDYTAEANEKNVDLYLAIHSNAFKGNARGTVTYFDHKGSDAERFAQIIDDDLMKIYPGPNRGIHEGKNRYGEGKPMWEPHDPKCPACLVEVAFHDNEIDSKWILENIEPIGQSLAHSILTFLAGDHPDALESADAAQAAPLPKFTKDELAIYVSPSNQIHNMGFGDFHSEKERMNEVADVVVPILEKQGLKVYRNDPENDIDDYTAEANEKNVDLYLAIHSNAYDGSARGTEAWCDHKDSEGERFAALVNDEIMKIYPGPNRGVKEGKNRYGEGKPMWEPHAPKCASVLVEVAFHDNETDSKWILDNIESVGQALARACLLHLAAEHPEALSK